MISTRCCTPTGRSSIRASGSTSKPYRSEISRIFRRVSSRSRKPPALVVSAAQGHVFRDGEDRDQHEVLVHHADAGGHGVAGSAEGDRFVVDQDLALGGLVQPVEDVHQRGLASAVLAEQTVNLPGLNNHVNVVVGYQGAEAFGDPLEFKFQNSDQSRSVSGTTLRPDVVCGAAAPA